MQKAPGRVSDVILRRHAEIEVLARVLPHQELGHTVPTGDWKSRLDPEFVGLRETILASLGISNDSRNRLPETPAPLVPSLMSASTFRA